MTCSPKSSCGLSFDKDTLSIRATVAEIEDALDWLRRLARERQWPKTAELALILSADEALTNIATHATEEMKSGLSKVELSCMQQAADSVTLRIEDDGEAFDPTQIEPGPTADSLDDAVIGGHGLRLMQHYLDSLEYVREDGRNVLVMSISLRSEQPPQT